MTTTNKHNEQYKALWRASASEAVPYTDDFPEPLLILPELTDGSIGKGKATKIEIEFDITNPEKVYVTHRDNGRGISSSELPRLFSWANSKSSSSEHRYGHGSKKALTKISPDYDTAEFRLLFKMIGQLHSITGPWDDFQKMAESVKVVEHTESNQNIGFEWMMNSDMGIFGEKRELYKDPRNLFLAMKEVLTSRYNAYHFDNCEYVLSVKCGPEFISESSKTNSWKTLEQMLDESKNATQKYKFSFPWKSVTVDYTEYKLSRNDDTISEAFPTYGVRSIPASRCHIANDGRFIEPMRAERFEKRKLHNSMNRTIAFINVRSSEDDSESYKDQPVPCTTKVSFQEQCPNLNGILDRIRSERKRIDTEAKPKVPRKPKKSKTEEETASAADAVAASPSPSEEPVYSEDDGDSMDEEYKEEEEPKPEEKKSKKAKKAVVEEEPVAAAGDPLLESVKKNIENMTDDEKAKWMVDKLLAVSKKAMCHMTDEASLIWQFYMEEEWGMKL